MAKIIVKNDISAIISQNSDLLKFLYENLRFRDRNYFHNRAYRQRIWDGFTNFFNRTNGKFLTGLLPEILVACKACNEPVDIVDQRTKIDFAIKEINSTFLHSCTPHGANPITLEDYQVDLVNAAIKNKRGVIFAPTSAGKAQPLHSLVATPNGFVTMGSLKVGDEVCLPHGGCAPILAIHPQGKKKKSKQILRASFLLWLEAIKFKVSTKN
jgi:hypothetical protein